MNRIAIVVLVTGLLLAPLALADTLTLTNGDILTGKVESIVAGKVIFATDLLGKQEIDLSQITSIATEAPLPVELTDGTRFNARISAADATSITFAGIRDLPSQKVGRDELASVNPPIPPKPAWKGDVTAGLTSTHGNSFAENANLSANASLRREKDRTTLSAAYLFGRSEDRTGEKYTTEESFAISGKYDYYFSKKWYGFVNSRYKTDHIADLDHRIIAGFGSGYQWIESDQTNFSTDLGISQLCEKYTSGDLVTNSSELSARLGYQVDHKFTDRITFNHQMEYYPSIQSGPSDYFLSTSAELRMNLTSRMYSSLKGILDFDSTPAAGLSTTDTKYILGLGWSF